MNDDLNELRIQLAFERGFIPPEASETEVAIGLETMHEAPLDALGRFAVDQAS